jgi:hypothetical protein
MFCDDIVDTGRIHYFSCECGFRSDPYDKAAVDAHLEHPHYTDGLIRDLRARLAYYDSVVYFDMGKLVACRGGDKDTTTIAIDPQRVHDIVDRNRTLEAELAKRDARDEYYGCSR